MSHPPIADPPDPPDPAPAEWSWDTAITVDGVDYPGRFLAGAGRWPRTALVRGLPPCFEDHLLRAAQDGEGELAWHAEPRAGDSPGARLERSRGRLRHDLAGDGSTFLTLLGARADGSLDLIGGACAHRRIAGEYDSERWHVLARALTLPDLRGLGLARHAAVPFLRAARALCGGQPLGFLAEAPALPSVMLLDRGVRHGVLDAVVAFGSRRRPDAVDRTYLALYRGARRWLFEGGARAAEITRLSPLVAETIALCEAAWIAGLDHHRCQELGTLSLTCEPELRALAQHTPFFSVYLDFLTSLHAWGLFHGVAVD
jgi:hypothetical protein